MPLATSTIIIGSALIWIFLCLRANGASRSFLGLALFATACGGFTVIGPAADAYRTGTLRLAVFIPILALGLAVVLLGPALAHLAQSSNAKAPSDLFPARFGGRRWPLAPLDLFVIAIGFSLMVLQGELLVLVLRRAAAGSETIIAMIALAVFLMPALKGRLAGMTLAQGGVAITILLLFLLGTVALIAETKLPTLSTAMTAADWRPFSMAGFLAFPGLWRRLALAPQDSRRAGFAFLLAGLLLVAGAACLGSAATVLFPRTVGPAWETLPNPIVDPTGTDFSGAFLAVAAEAPPNQSSPAFAAAPLIGVLAILILMNLTAGAQAVGVMLSRNSGLGERLSHGLVTAGLIAWLGFHANRWIVVAGPFVGEFGMMAPALLAQFLPFAIDLAWPRRGRKWAAVAGLLAGWAIVIILSEPSRQVFTSQRPLIATRFALYFDSTAGLAAALSVNAGAFIAGSLLSFAAFGSRKPSSAEGVTHTPAKI